MPAVPAGGRKDDERRKPPDAVSLSPAGRRSGKGGAPPLEGKVAAVNGERRKMRSAPLFLLRSAGRRKWRWGGWSPPVNWAPGWWSPSSFDCRRRGMPRGSRPVVLQPVGKRCSAAADDEEEDDLLDPCDGKVWLADGFIAVYGGLCTVVAVYGASSRGVWGFFPLGPLAVHGGVLTVWFGSAVICYVKKGPVQIFIWSWSTCVLVHMVHISWSLGSTWVHAADIGIKPN